MVGKKQLSALSYQLSGRLSGDHGRRGWWCGIEALSWIVSIAIYRWRRFDDLEFGD
ncbi:MAG: hypothetical protein ABSF23_12675 [Terracidiphilus sp.]